MMSLPSTNMVAALRYISEGLCYFKAIGSDIYFPIPEEKSPGLIIWLETKLGEKMADKIDSILQRRKREEEQRKLKSQQKAG